MLVQSGSISLSDSSATITLDTPVRVGESWVLANASGSGTGVLSNFAVMATLQTVVDDHYTELAFSRATTTATLTVEWQVITGTEFTVQTAETALLGSNETPSIAAVDLSKAFVVGTWRPGPSSTGNAEYAPRISLTDSTTLDLTRVSTSGTDSTRVRWYVVEWEGATVQRGILDFPNDAQLTATISAVTPANAFVLGSWWSGTISRADRYFMRSIITDSTTVTIDKGSSSTEGGGASYAWFVVSHPSITAQHAQPILLTTETSDTVTVDSVDATKSFLAANWHGNAFCTMASSTLTLQHGAGTQALTNATTVTVAREEATDSEARFGVQLVEVADSGAAPDPATISLASVTDTEVRISIDTYDATASQHNMRRWNTDPGASPDPGTADATFTNIDPTLEFVDSTVSADSDYWYALESVE